MATRILLQSLACTFALVASVAVSGCSAEAENDLLEDGAAETEDGEGDAIAETDQAIRQRTIPLWTYAAPSAPERPNKLTSLRLLRDGDGHLRYVRSRYFQCTDAGCNTTTERGLAGYRYNRTTDKTSLVFYTEAGAVRDAYAYTTSTTSGYLTLNMTRGPVSFKMYESE